MTDHKDVTGAEILQMLNAARHGGLSFNNMSNVEEHIKQAHHVFDLQSPEALVLRARHYRALLVNELDSVDLMLSIK